MAALLHAQGLGTADANLITLVCRGATLWFAVILGLLALPFALTSLTKPLRRPEDSVEGGA
jgi:hypothetical protein